MSLAPTLSAAAAASVALALGPRLPANQAVDSFVMLGSSSHAAGGFDSSMRLNPSATSALHASITGGDLRRSGRVEALRCVCVPSAAVTRVLRRPCAHGSSHVGADDLARVRTRLRASTAWRCWRSSADGAWLSLLLLLLNREAKPHTACLAASQ